MEEWRTSERRNLMVSIIAEAMRAYPGVLNRSPNDVENTIYQKAKFEAEYNQTVDEVIILIRNQGRRQQVGDSKLQEPSSVKQNEPDISAEKKKTREREEETHEDKLLISTAAMTAFNHWVTMCLSKLRTMGAPGSGKTSVLDLTMGEDPMRPEDRDSTGCIKTRDITITPILAHEELWEKVTPDRMNDMVRKALKDKIDKQKKTRDVPPTTTSSSHHPTRPRPLTVFTDLVDKLENTVGSEELMKVHWVFTQDTGGQPCYQSVAPLLLRENSCSIITTKLNEKFESKPVFDFYIEGEKVSMSEAKIQLTNLQMIETLVKSQVPVDPSKAPKYIIVGTFEDEADDFEETIGTKNAILKERLSGLEDQRIDYGRSIIFPINAVTQKKKERNEKADWLRRNIVGSPVEETVNIRWFGLLLHLITEDKDTYTLDECLEAGRSLRMGKDEIEEALEFFHGLGIMIHFRKQDLLRGVIILKVEVVFSTLSLLLGISFMDRDILAIKFKLIFSDNLVKTQERLQKYGRFKKKLLHENKKVFKFSDVFTAEYFLHLLEHVTAVIAVGEDEYFLPSALAFATDEEIEQRVEGEPWIIRLIRKEKYCEPINIPPPHAYLSSVFINVLKCFPECTLPSDEDGQFCQQYSNAMSLSYSDGFIHFIQRVHQIEVYFSECEDQPRKCHAIRSAVLTATKITEMLLEIPPGTLVKNDAFLCPCEENSNGRHEYVFKTDKKKAWCKKSKKDLELTPSQQRWLDEPQDTKTKVSSNPKVQVDGDGSSSEKYGCKVFYQRRDVNTWKITFAVFPCDKSYVVKCNGDEQEGPSCHFDLETDKLEIASKEQPGWPWSSKVTRKEVTKASVDAYTGNGNPPFCEMIVKAASSQSPPPSLAMDVELEGPRPPKIMILERPTENLSIQAPEEQLQEQQTDGPRKRPGRKNDSSNKSVPEKVKRRCGWPSKQDLLTCVLIFAVVSLLIFLSIYILTTKNGKDFSTIDCYQKPVKPSPPSKCHMIDQSADVYLYLRQEDFSLTDTKEFGLYLKLTNAELNNLKDESRGKGAVFLNEVVDMWYKKAPPPACWETIYDALWKVPNRPLANKVKKEYMTV